jgi:iron-sulfur cluster assembly accessory protein
VRSSIVEQQELDRTRSVAPRRRQGRRLQRLQLHPRPHRDRSRTTDEVFEQHGIRVVCDPKSLLYLNGTTVDFKDELMGRGFVFNNPNATSTCGCGSSFSA